MDKVEKNVKEENTASESDPENKKQSPTSSLASSPARSGFSDECTIDAPQYEATSKRISRENNDVTASSDELPVKRVRFDKNVDNHNEIVKKDEEETMETPSELNVGKDMEETMDTYVQLNVGKDVKETVDIYVQLNVGKDVKETIETYAELNGGKDVKETTEIPEVLNVGKEVKEKMETYAELNVGKGVKETIEKSSKLIVGKDVKPTAGRTTSKSNYMHKVKWVEWEDSYFPIITQNENGPCPLIAIVNILLLRKKVSLSDGTTEISAEKLVEHVRAALDSTVPKDCDPNHFQNMQDAVAVLPQLQTGLDVNVKFTGVKNFEYTTECIIFDLLNIHLYHGWLLDPQSPEVVSAVGNSSYNQLVEMIINKKASKDIMERNQAEAANQFLEATATQLTCHGLCELNAAMENGELAVLFRNNHFSVIYKHKESLYQLVTDQGYLEEKRVVWETLSTIFGDETFLDGNFQCLLPKGPTLDADEEQQISQDFLMALSLQDEQNKQQDKEFAWNTYDNGAMGVTSDEELAKKLFIEEQRMAQVSVSTGRTSLTSQQTERAESVERRVCPVIPQQSAPAAAASKETEETSKSKEWKCTVS